MTNPISEHSEEAHDSRDHLAKIAAIQKIVAEGLESGISELSMDDVRKLVRKKVGLE